MGSSLFRKQAIKFQNDRLHGNVFVTPSVSKSLVTLLLVTWVVAVGIWLSTSQLARKETVQGWLEPTSGVAKVYGESSSGKVRQVLVSEGEVVSVGQPLIIVNGDLALSNGKHLEESLLDEYREQLRLVNRQLNRLPHTYQLQIDDSNQELKTSSKNLKLLESQLKSLATHYELVSKQVSDYTQMAEKGHISWLEVDTRKEKQLSIENQLKSLNREKVDLISRIEQLKNQQILLNQEKQNRFDELSSRLSEISQQTSRLQGERGYVLKAPVPGKVSNLQANIGQSVSADRPLLSIVPQKSELLLNILIPVRASGFVKPGQALDIRYDAFPYQKFGLYSGEIVNISESVLLPQELNQSLISVNEPTYLASARLAEMSVLAYGQEMPLKSGMTVSADIRLKERTILDWLLEPIYSLKGRL